MIVWTHAVLGFLHACVLLYFCICTCSVQLSMFHMERRSRNVIIIIITIYQSSYFHIVELYATHVELKCPSETMFCSQGKQ